MTEPTSAPLPSDPYEYLVPYASDPGITVKFYHYGPRRLLNVRVVGAITEAIRDRKEHEDDPDGEMGTKERQYEDGDVVILLHPTPGTCSLSCYESCVLRIRTHCERHKYCQGANLTQNSSVEMYWFDWGVAIKGLWNFTQTYENVEMYYDIFEEGVGLIGTGALSMW